MTVSWSRVRPTSIAQAVNRIGTPKWPRERGGLVRGGYRYLLRDPDITRPYQGWAADMTFIPLARAFVQPAAILDVFSHRVLAWRLSSRLDARSCT